MEYPVRPPFFAMRFIRLLAKSAAAMHIGADGCYFLCLVVGQEDACRYSRPVSYWNHQLATLLGLRGGDEHGLRRIRERCVRAGWLEYAGGNKRQPARYFVTIPAAVTTLSDSACDESPEEYRCNTADNSPLKRQESGRKAAGKRQESAEKAAPFSPTPSPIPIPKDMCDESFLVFWESYGLKKGKPAAARAWKKLSQADKDAAVAGIATYRSTVRDPQFQKHPATYINGRTWEDEIPERKLTQEDCPHPLGTDAAWVWIGLNCPETVK